MVTVHDYSAEAIAACRAVLIELVHGMGEFRDHLVVVGGWVPALLLPNAPEPYVGTLDVDLALDFQHIPEATYQTVLEALQRRGYRQDARQPFRFLRDVPCPGQPPITGWWISSRENTEAPGDHTAPKWSRMPARARRGGAIWRSSTGKVSRSRATSQGVVGTQ